MALPKFTHLQFLVVSELAKGESAGRAVREHLRASGVRQSGPAFYQLMAGLEDGGYVSGWYEQQIVDSQIIRERYYKVTAAGIRAAEDSLEFYRRGALPRHVKAAHAR
jgi:hypothetical protein